MSTAYRSTEMPAGPLLARALALGACLAMMVAGCGGASLTAVQQGSDLAEGAASLTGPTMRPCDPKWLNLPLQLDTDPLTPSPYGNNVDTAYLESLFQVNPSVKLVIKGRFPMVRFVSVQTGTADGNLGGSQVTGFIPDYELVMDPGSLNPFVQGNPVGGAAREYTLEILPPGATSSAPNQIRLPQGTADKQIILIRYYSPNSNITITEADLPKVYAQDVASGAPAACSFIALPNWTRFPLWLWGVTGQPGPAITFAPVTCGGGCNSAIPAYLAAQPRLFPGEVAVIRFKAPTFINTRTGTGLFPDPSGYDTRYWSMTEVDPTDSMAVNGLVDHLATPTNGEVTLVVSSNPSVRSMALTRGQNFIQDLRAPQAASAVFVYRNLVPSQSFWPQGVDYPAAYVPRGVVCSALEYLADSPKCIP